MYFPSPVDPSEAIVAAVATVVTMGLETNTMPPAMGQNMMGWM
jgi:hypothetical protein